MTDQGPKRIVKKPAVGRAQTHRTCVLVLGMHRSGTSVLTRAISLLGAALPKNLPDSNEANETGYWEPVRLILLHDRMLAEAGGTWDDWRAFDPSELPRRRLEFYKAEIRRLLFEEYGDAPLIVLKEPRISRFVPIYSDILGSMGYDVRYVISGRNPLEVIGSLSKRDESTAGFGGMLWLRHVLDVERDTRGKSRVFLKYDDLVTDWRKTLTRIVSSLDIVWPNTIDEAASNLDRHISAKHRRNVADLSMLLADTRLTDWVKDTYTAFLALERDSADVGATSTLDRVRNEFDAAAAVFGDMFYAELNARQAKVTIQSSHQIAQLSAEHARHVAEMSNSIAEARGQALELETRIGQITIERDDLANQLNGRDDEIKRLTAEKDMFLSQLTQSLSDAEQKTSAAAKKIEQITVERDDLANQLSDAQEKTSAAAQKIEQISIELNDLVSEIAKLNSEKELLVAECKAYSMKEASLIQELSSATRVADARQFEVERILARQRIVEHAKNTWEQKFREVELEIIRRNERELDAIGSIGILKTKFLESHQANKALRYVLSEIGESIASFSSDANDALDQLKKSVELREAALREALARIDAMRNSTSWRLTRGLRLVKHLVARPTYVLDWLKRSLSFSTASVPVTTPATEPAETSVPKLILSEIDLTSRIRAAIAEHAAPALAAEGSDFGREIELLVSNTTDRPSNLTAPLVEFRDQVLATSAKTARIDLEYVGRSTQTVDFSRAHIQSIAFYLPQFHPFAENDQWWGKGFTEWTNVSKAVPQYLGHYQPHLPGELGFYDLRLVDIMRQQVELAKLYGISGFCFHHYWFGGKRLMERPVNQFLDNPDIDFPFCICWANENWTRRWDGQENDVLIAQNHSPEDDIAFIEDLERTLKDPRYIRFNGRPILIVYRASLLPDPMATANRWRERCRELGIGEIYLIAARSFHITDPRPYGFDAAVEFPPHQIPAARLNDLVTIVNPHFSGNIYSYADLSDGYARQDVEGYPLIKTVSPSWDNEARKPGAGHVFHGANPLSYSRWLRRAYEYTAAKVAGDGNHPPFIFINAWNEWAEGAYLEPDRKYGYAYLHATASIAREYLQPEDEVLAIVEQSQAAFQKTSDVAVVVHLFFTDLYDELARYIRNAGSGDVFVSLTADVPADVCRRLIADFPNARLAIFPNRGRDIQPFLGILPLLRKLGYSLVCKIHTKKSPQRADGSRLRRGALESLLGSERVVDEIRMQFEATSELGFVAPKDSILSLGGADRNVLNREWLDRLLPQCGLSHLVGNYECEFIAGSMYWARVAALEEVAALGLEADDFENEVGQYDGTLAHAVERLIPVTAQRWKYAETRT